MHNDKFIYSDEDKIDEIVNSSTQWVGKEMRRKKLTNAWSNMHGNNRKELKKELLYKFIT